MSPFLTKAISLSEIGYAIIPIPAGQKRPVFKDWQNYQADPFRVEMEWPQTGNIGCLTRNTPAIDIDCTIEEVALQMEEFVHFLLGETPVRVGRAPKRLLLFRTDTPFRKVDSGFFTDADGNDHKLEILGDGQQFVAYGIHPDTRKPYQWVSERQMSDVPAADLPVLTAADAELVVAEFVRVATARGWVPKSSATAPRGEQDEFWFLRGKPDVTDEEVVKAVTAFPNPGRDYDLWVKVGAALHNHFEGSGDGLQLWHDWSSRSDLYSDADTDRKWASFGRYTGQPTTVGFLLAATREKREVGKVKAKTEAAQDKRKPLRDAIAACDDADELINGILAQVAAANLDPLGLDVVLKEINTRRKALKASPVSIHVLKRAASSLAAGEQGEDAGLGLRLEVELANKVLDMRFAGGTHLMFFSELWWHYRGGVWRRTEENMVASAVQECVLRLQGESDETALMLAAAVAESRGDRLSAIVDSVLRTMKRTVGQDGHDDPLDLQSHEPPRVVNCTNGELWFELDGTCKFKPHNPESRLTSQVGCAFDPKATCPTWDAMCEKVFQTCKNPTDMIRHFHELFGYMLQPDRHHAMSIMLKGPGGNGKSTLTDIVRSVMGRDAVLSTSIADLAKGANAHFTDSCQGKLMLLDDDFKKDALLPDDWIKKFSEAKSLSANPKFGRPYEFMARCTPVILTNFWPPTADLSDGILRRMMIIETSHKLTEAEKDPAHVLAVKRDELPGVLNRLLQGLVRVLKRGQRFDVPAECEESKRQWFKSSNATVRFVSEVLDQTGEKSDRVACASVYDAYRQWAAHDGGRVRELGRNKFYEALEALGIKRRNHSGVLVFSGVKVRTTEGVENMFMQT